MYFTFYPLYRPVSRVLRDLRNAPPAVNSSHLNAAVASGALAFAIYRVALKRKNRLAQVFIFVQL